MVFGGDVFFVCCERVVTSLEISCLHVVIAPQKQVFYFKPEKYLINRKKDIVIWKWKGKSILLYSVYQWSIQSEYFEL